MRTTVETGALSIVEMSTHDNLRAPSRISSINDQLTDVRFHKIFDTT
jgi:hypothetical protein